MSAPSVMAQNSTTATPAASSESAPVLEPEKPIKAVVPAMPPAAPPIEQQSPAQRPYAPPSTGYEPPATSYQPAPHEQPYAYHPFQYPYQPEPEYGASPRYPYGSPMYAPPQQEPPYRATTYDYSHRPSGYAPSGLTIPIDLQTAISTQVAKEGDYIQAKVNENVPLNGVSYIPAGTVVSGEISESEAGRRLSRSGSLNIEFNQMRLPNGQIIEISGHLVGKIGRYNYGKNDELHGETWKAKLGQFALRGLGGAGLGAALGTGIGAIGGGGYGAGTGAWSGAAIGGGLGGLDMLLRKGRDVIIPSGTKMELQLDQPLNLPPPGPPTYPT
ncbi:MAG TPA: hypothetical protein V6C81_24485 [Planktothrix sp.]